MMKFLKITLLAAIVLSLTYCTKEAVDAAKKSVGVAQAWTTHGEKFLAAVEDGALCATQFHPEKSGKAGLTLIANWSAAL